MTDKQIVDSWHSVKFPGSYSNVQYFVKGLRKRGLVKHRSLNDIKKLLENDLYYQTSRSVRKRFITRPDVSNYFSSRMEIDLFDIGKNRFRDAKSGRVKGRYGLALIDNFSKTIFLKPLPSKKSAAVLKAFKAVMNSLKPPFTYPGKIF